MAIVNITKNNTIDEWRIQTNQSANALNTLETGNYTKSNGTLTLNSNSSLVITANGTTLQVSNTVLFQTRLEVGNVISLGVRESGTGNLTVGNTVSIFGPNTALFVANNATVNTNLTVGRSLNVGTTLFVANDATMNTNLTVTRNLLLTNTGNVLFVNSGSANIQTIFATNVYVKTLNVNGTAFIATTNSAPINYNTATGQISHALSGATAGTYANSSHVPVITVDTTGHITTISNTAIRAATTSVTGIVQLIDSVTSTSTTLAATANAVNTVYSYAQTKSSAITINNGTGISGGGTGNTFTLSIGQDVATTANVQFRTIGVGTTADTANAGSIRATGDITAFYSDERMKEDIVNIANALNKVKNIRGVHYTPNDVAVTYGYKKDRKVGVIAQDVEKVLPEIVVAAPFDIDVNGNSISGENYKTVQYDKLVPLLIEAIKELSREVDDLRNKTNNK